MQPRIRGSVLLRNAVVCVGAATFACASHSLLIAQVADGFYSPRPEKLTPINDTPAVAFVGPLVSEMKICGHPGCYMKARLPLIGISSNPAAPVIRLGNPPVIRQLRIDVTGKFRFGELRSGSNEPALLSLPPAVKTSFAAMMQEALAGNEAMRVRRDTTAMKEPARINSLDQRFSERDLPFLALIIGVGSAGVFAASQVLYPPQRKHRRFVPSEPERSHTKTISSYKRKC